MKYTFILLLGMAFNYCYSQDYEEKICDCISANLAQVDRDFNSIMDSIKLDLIHNDIIDTTAESQIQQLKVIQQDGKIKHARSYENIFWEQMGTRTIRYCVNLHTYSSGKDIDRTYFAMYKKLMRAEITSIGSRDYLALRKNIAGIVLEYSNNSTSQLMNIVQLNYLYHFTETEEEKSILIKLPPFSEHKLSDTSNNSTIFINSNDEIFFNNQKIKIEDLCETIKEPIQAKEGFRLVNERNTSYKSYLSVYNEIKNCVERTRNSLAEKYFSKPFDSLSEEEQQEIRTKLPLKLYETPPK